MEDKEKPKQQLIFELGELRQRIADLEKPEKESNRAEEISQEARRFAESIIETMREPFVVLDKDLRVLSANRSFYNTFKVTHGETEGDLIYDIGNKQWNIPSLRTLLEEILPKKIEFNNYEVSHKFQTIGQKIMLLNARQIYQKVIGTPMILLAIEDITERRLIEIELEAAAERYRRLFETTPDGLLLLDKKTGRIISVNPAIEKLLGYSSEEFIGKVLKDIGLMKDIEDFQTIIQILNEVGLVHYDLVSAETKDGKSIDTEIYLTDRAKVLQCNVRDITRRRRAEMLIHEARKYAESIIDTVREPFVVLDKDLKVLSANRSFYSTFEVRPEETVGNLIYDIGNRQWNIPSLRKLLEEILPKNTQFIDYEVSHKFQTIGQKTMLLNARQIHQEVIGTPMILLAIEDRTENRRMEEELGKYRDHLEQKIEERTAELKMTNEQLLQEITEHKRAVENLRKVNRAYKTLSQCNNILIRATNEPEFLHEICRAIVESGGYRMAWMGFAEQDEEKTVHPAAQAGYEEGYLENTKITWADNEHGRGPTGTAIRTGKYRAVRNILTDPNYFPWRGEAKKRGYASTIALPLIADGKPFGALSIYAVEPDAFDEKELALLTELAEDMAYGITSLRQNTGRKKAEEIQRKLSSAVEHTADIVVIANKDGTIEYVNPAFEKITGYTMEEAVGKTPRILKSGKQDEKFYENLWGTILSGEVFYGVLINKKNNGELYYAEKTITPIKDEHGTITHFVSTDKDITVQKKAEEVILENKRLEAADKAKSEFLANMSHELRTPLNASIGFSELLKLGMAGELSEKQKHYVNNIYTSSQFLLSLINDILDLSKIEAGKIELVPDKMSVPATIKETLSLIKEKAMKHKVLLKTDFDPELDVIEADRQRFKQILFNLLSNAVKFSKEEGGTVTIIAKKEADMAQISVSDTGIGIKEENIGRLFHKFEQLEKGISEKYGGTGLGLDITKHLVELHGGKIRAESSYRKGSTFTFLLPIEAKKEGKD